MNKLQKEIQKVEKAKGNQAYVYSVKKLGIDPSKKLKELRNEGLI